MNDVHIVLGQAHLCQGGNQAEVNGGGGSAEDGLASPGVGVAQDVGIAFYVNIAVTNLRGDIIVEGDSFPPDNSSPEKLVSTISKECLSMLWKASIPVEKLLGVGVTIIGPVNQLEGVALHPFRLFDQPVMLRKYFEAEFPVPVAVESNVCAFLVSELLYTNIADPSPEIRRQTPPFDINETHIFWKADSSAFCSVSTMKTPSVKTSDLRGWVESTDQMGMLFGDMTPFLNLPSGLANGEYRRVEMHDLGECTAYNKLHGFEETHVWCHVFYLGDTLYKKFILCAKRDTTSWKAECTFPSDSEALLPIDAVPPGQVFGSFFPADDH